MVKTEKINNTLQIEIPEEATIFYIEEDTEVIRKAISESEPELIEIDGINIENIDTSYFQLICSILKTAEEENYRINLKKNKILSDFFDLYGIKH